MLFRSNLEALLSEAGEKVVITLFTPMRQLRDVLLTRGNEQYYHRYNLRRREDSTLDAELLFRSWTHRDFREA